MTENKRFTLCAGTINGLKSYYEYDRMPLTHLQVLTLFNKLYDKNKELSEENKQLKQFVNNLKDIIIKITIAYQRKYDRNIIDLVHEIYEEDISDLIKELISNE